VARERLVAVSYPVDDEFMEINASVLRADAQVTFVAGLAEQARREALSQADALIAWQPGQELPDGMLSESPRLEFIQLLPAGADGIIDYAAIPQRIVLASNVGAYSEPIAEHVMALTLALARRLPQRNAAMARGEFDQEELLLTLDGAICAILGFGGIGTSTARLMRAFGAKIYALNSSGHTTEPVDFAGTLADLDSVLAIADVVVISLPLTRTTSGLIGARELRLMKPAAILVNVARAAIVDERALYEHLRDNPEFCAGIDAWWHEPGPEPGSSFRTDYPFFGLPNVIGSPHNSGSVPGVLQTAARKAAENVRRYLREEPVTGLIHREDYPPRG
jgi:phosphoglycerate dehydrogenase-like enzyme